VFHYVAVCCEGFELISVCTCMYVCCSVFCVYMDLCVLKCVNILQYQCVAVCCGVLQCVIFVLQSVTSCRSVLRDFCVDFVCACVCNVYMQVRKINVEIHHKTNAHKHNVPFLSCHRMP